MSESEDTAKFLELWPELEDHQIEWIGKGAYANCYSIDNKTVLKRYTPQGIDSLRIQFVAEEIKDEEEQKKKTLENLMQRMPAPNRYMPKLVKKYCKEDLIAYGMVHGITLKDIIEWSSKLEFPFPMRLKIACAIADPIIHLQKINKVHGDFTPANILIQGFEPDHENGTYMQVKKDGERCKHTRPQAKLIDWDHTQDVPDRKKAYSIFDCQSSVSGTPEYSPSDYISSGAYHRNSETESLGKIWYEIFTGEMLCKDARGLDPVDLIIYGDMMEETFSTLPDFKVEDVSEDVQEGLRAVIIETLKPRHTRPTAEQAKERLKQYVTAPLVY